MSAKCGRHVPTPPIKDTPAAAPRHVGRASGATSTVNRRVRHNRRRRGRHEPTPRPTSHVANGRVHSTSQRSLSPRRWSTVCDDTTSSAKSRRRRRTHRAMECGNHDSARSNLIHQRTHLSGALTPPRPTSHARSSRAQLDFAEVVASSQIVDRLRRHHQLCEVALATAQRPEAAVGACVRAWATAILMSASNGHLTLW